MDFVELQRCFVRIRKDQEPILELTRAWGLRFGGWIDWSTLREQRRVVLLAEASSGKSAEFRNQAKTLRSAGCPTFFVTIEELADQGFDASLEPASIESFEQWRGGTRDGWFFLDSIDEARLNRKSFEVALKRFARALGSSLDRARIFISCRVSDWKGAEDRGFIERLLPAWDRAKEELPEADPLLDPLFKEEKRSGSRALEETKLEINDLTVVQLVPLSLDQCRVVATYLGIQNVDAFIKGVEQNGLEAFAERPGDVIDLVEYWKEFGKFGSFAQMVEHGVEYKLREIDQYRPDNEALSLEKAREGAERIAAALTFAKSFTLRAAGHDNEGGLAAGALDAATILNNWTEAKRNALLRRGVFAPATYGRIRFHHRSTQEYLTARWLDRLLRGSGPRQEIWNLLFANRYGVDTIVPSLRPAAAWLGLSHDDIRREITIREPLVLIGHGDPRSLSIDARALLLTAYAAKQARDEIADDSLDNRDVWMFADSRLSAAIRDAWNTNPNAEFRLNLLRFIREGSITQCVDLARSVALDRQARYSHRIVALQALVACGDAPGLWAVSRDLVTDAANLPLRLSVEAAKILYPDHLSLDGLFVLIESVTPPREFSGEGFGYAISQLYEATAAPQRSEFVARLATLCLSEPFVEWHRRISKRYVELAKHVDSIAHREVEVNGDAEPPRSLINLLMTVERTERERRRDDEGPTLAQRVQAKPEIVRALFWADVEEQRAHGRPGQADPVYYWQVMNPHPLWHFQESDLEWLEEDLRNRSAEADRRIALSAIVYILRNSGRVEAERARLEILVRDRPLLAEDLISYLTPSPHVLAQMRREREEAARYQRQHAAKEEEAKASWREFKQALRDDPEQLRDPQKLKSWKAGAWRLRPLTQWLTHRSGANEETAPEQWRLLEEAYGRPVAEAYRDGMAIYWRATKPARPRRGEGTAMIVKYANILAFAAIGIEPKEDPDWTTRLSNGEAKRAALHGCLTERSYPDWMDALIASHPAIVLPVIRQALRHEYLSPTAGITNFLHRYGGGPQALHPAVQKIAFDVIVTKEPVDPNKYRSMVGIVEKIDLVPEQRRRLYRVTAARFTAHRTAQRDAEMLWSLAMLLHLDFGQGLAELESYLNSASPGEAKARAEKAIAFLFDRHNPIIPMALPNAPVEGLERLLRLVYSYVRPEADAHHEGSFTPDTRDHAENARNSVLGTLLERPGADAYRAMCRVAEDPLFALRASRFRELARSKAERDAELLPWTPKEVLTFERQRTAPVKTGTDLLRVVEGVIQDIQLQLDKGDASSRRLLQRAQDEDEVQNWLAEQLNLRARDRFRAFREAEVAKGDKPDVIAASTAAPCEVAIEVKHSKSWSLRQLEDALRNQLAEDYLKPEARRQGILVITHHLARKWRDMETNEWVTFADLMQRLAAIAATIDHNSSGAIELRCLGIDASEPG
jgi:hypothetical protein